MTLRDDIRSKIALVMIDVAMRIAPRSMRLKMYATMAFGLKAWIEEKRAS